MTDATTHGHSHEGGHVHTPGHAHPPVHVHDAAASGAIRARPASRAFSLIEASAGGRLLPLALALAALWGAVYWALH